MTENMLNGPARATRSHMLCEGTVTDWAKAHENSRTASEGAGRPMIFIQPQIKFSLLLSQLLTYSLHAFVNGNVSLTRPYFQGAKPPKA
jgi:hypothetical protein